MDILQAYHEAFDNENDGHDFTLIKYLEKLFVGKDAEGNVAVVIISNRPNRKPLRQKTKLLSVECNSAVEYYLDGEKYSDVVHIIRCYAQSDKEKEIFIELTPLFGQASEDFDQEASILETVAILSSFFADKREPSLTELEGLFAELYTIWDYNSQLDLKRYWQSEDRMKFDFSISEKDKIEIKSTLKSERRHHFRHEQLLGEYFSIYVISYMMRKDDEGLSLYDLIDKTRPYLIDEPKKMLIIDKYIKNTSVETLKATRFNEYYMRLNRRIYKADNIPKFSEMTPSGVSNAEYDCLLDNVEPVGEDEFIENVSNIIDSSEKRE